MTLGDIGMKFVETKAWDATHVDVPEYLEQQPSDKTLYLVTRAELTIARSQKLLGEIRELKASLNLQA